MKKWLKLGAVIIPLLALTGCFSGSSSNNLINMTTTYDAGGINFVHIENDGVGNVTVTGSDSAKSIEVAINGTVTSQSDISKYVSVSAVGETYYIYIKSEDGKAIDAVKANITVTLPSDLELESLIVLQGNLSVTNIMGEIDSVTQKNGIISLLEIDSFRGSINLENSSGRIDYYNVDGNIQLNVDNSAALAVKDLTVNIDETIEPIFITGTMTGESYFKVEPVYSTNLTVSNNDQSVSGYIPNPPTSETMTVSVQNCNVTFDDGTDN